MDPWVRFERALQNMEEPGPELHVVIQDLDTTDLGSEADRLELRASAKAVLAGGQDLPLAEAVKEVKRAEAAGRAGWPHLYLAMTAVRLGRPEVALDSVSRVPPGYFDDLDLRWRSIQLKAVAAEAHVLMGNEAKARSLVKTLNREFRAETVDEVFAPPVSLARRLIDVGPPNELLWELLDGLNADDWLGPELAAAVAAVHKGVPRDDGA